MKRYVPWRLKYGLKIWLSKAPISYGFWKRLGIFEHGAMEDPEYAIRTVGRHLEALGLKASETPFTGLELGPGDSLASAFIARAAGARETWLADVGDYANQDPAVYRKLVEALQPSDQLPLAALPATFEDALTWTGGRYLTNGLESLRSLPSGSVDAIWSQSVLEHIHRDEFLAMMRECYRLLSPSGGCSHSVDLKDHLGSSLNNLRFAEPEWERSTIWNAGFYTNRIRYGEMLDLFRQAAFEVEVVSEERWPKLPIDRAKLAPAFRDVPEQDLLVHSFRVILRRR